MRTIWLFRSNILELEYYHKYRDLETFENNCHDFYLLILLYYLKNDIFDEVIVWRLSKRKTRDIVFDVNGKKFIQRWVKSFREVYKYSSPDISLFRGGFPEYGEVVRENSSLFNKKLYLGAGRRLFPQYGGKYDIILLEDERDFNKSYNCFPFYKTANPRIFKSLDFETKKYDLSWICNFTQIRHKGQKFFISTVAKSSFLKSLHIVHVGNKPEVGEELCRRFNVTNIKFAGWVKRPDLNKLINKSKFGIVTSNSMDGCPRASTEILCSGTPLLIRDQTRLLNYYKKIGVVEFSDNTLEEKVKQALSNYKKYFEDNMLSINRLSFDTICKMNLDLWE